MKEQDVAQAPCKSARMQGANRKWLALLPVIALAAALFDPFAQAAPRAVQPASRESLKAKAERQQQEKFMRRAIALARKGARNGDGGPFGTVIVRNGVIVGEGWNHVVSGNDPTAHGEIMAIRDACRKMKTFSLKGCEIYTSGEPCPMCMSAIYWAHADRVFYGFNVEDAAHVGFDDSMIYRELNKKIGQRRIPEKQILGGEARKLLKEYFAMPNRRKY